MEGTIKTEIVFIPSPGRGHLSATLEMAKLLVDRDQRLSVTVLVIKPFYDPKGTAHSYSDHISETSPRIRFIDIPQVEYSLTGSFHLPHFIESHKIHVRDEVAKIASESKLVGFVVDIFCVGMINVADEFGIPTYVFHTSGAAMLGFLFHFQGQLDYQNQDLMVFEDSNEELSIPSYLSPVSPKLLPSILIDKDINQILMNMARMLRRTR
ncbi:hypothetical protein CASFOL_022600 [Castilleja foliolosa]|uniref:Uncharacterized protein n=1 Tax=Castilleja foliolosa TaxID=1961234 RepID=A0ABD3CV10_9LAMI